MKRICLPFLLASVAFALPQKKVLAFYYPWYGTPQISGRWVHWDEAGHDPARILPSGVPDSATTNHPLKLYDSNDPAVIKEHLSLARWAGIDAFICSWWGRGDFSDNAFKKMLEVAKKEKSPVQLTVYYESIPQREEDWVKATIQDLLYILDNYGKHPSFFKVNGKPVIFIYGRAMGQLGDRWREVVKEVKRLKRQVAFICDSLDPRWLDTFDGLHEYNPVGAILAKADMLRRYRTCKEVCEKGGKISCATVIPGYDDFNVRPQNPTICSREDGELYKRLWEYAIQANVDWVLICSFNEWHEGTEIEPSVENGRLYLELTREFATYFKRGR